MDNNNPHHTPDWLKSFHWWVVSSSAGKDSQAMLDYMVKLADSVGFPRAQIIVLHSDLGRVEWAGTGDLARKQAEHYGLRFEVRSQVGQIATRGGKVYEKGAAYGDLLDYALRRGMWPSYAQRWCTSEYKRRVFDRFYTELARTTERPRGSGPVRILDCQGLRAEESPARAKLETTSVRKSTRNQHVETWLPIHDWTEGQVWKRIHASGVPHHRAYDLGMPRLSCALCVLAPRRAIKLAAKHNRPLLRLYVEAEETMGHDFNAKWSMGDLEREIEAGDGGDDAPIESWNM
jgi:3'-phosphoadenosine 5'-phosphosulfate sulfotransferase (PAPS reductase)/FAD synthetase